MDSRSDARLMAAAGPEGAAAGAAAAAGAMTGAHAGPPLTDDVLRELPRDGGAVRWLA